MDQDSANDQWRSYSDSQGTIAAAVEEAVRNRLQNRPSGPRNEATDNSIFAPLTEASVNASRQRSFQFAIDLFHKCFTLAREYEQNAKCELHKGAMTFNVAMAYLATGNFPAAMHFLELAQAETRLTRQSSSWDILGFDLFQHNYWSMLIPNMGSAPLDLYPEFWGKAFDKVQAQKDWEDLTDHSRILYVILIAERYAFRSLSAQPELAVSRSFSLHHWRLIADLARLLESELSARGTKASGLRGCVLQVNNSSPLAGFSAMIKHLHQQYPLPSGRSITDYNRHFTQLRQLIEDRRRPKVDRVAAAALLAGNTRNLVQHDIDPNAIIFRSCDAATFATDTLLSLCSLRRWAKP